MLRSLGDIACDIGIVGLAVWVAKISLWLAPLAVLLIGNRQRSLGDILHDGSHGSLHRSRGVNDLILRVLLAPLLFLSVTKYRRDHFLHHARLGDPNKDPDFISPLPGIDGWLARYWALVKDMRTWMESFAAHIADRDVDAAARLTIVAWWAALGAAIVSVAGIDTFTIFVTLWLLSRATSFHLITCYREMCDHYGLVPGGIGSYTRDIVASGFVEWLVHPRDKGLHLTHHLLPAVPYYRLRAAQQIFSEMHTYRAHARVRDDYAFARSGFLGSHADMLVGVS